MSELELIIRNSTIHGKIEASPSKSYTHRAIICASLSRKKTLIKNPLISDDTLATIDAMRLLGASIEIKDDEIEVDGTKFFGHLDFEKPPQVTINCRESGSTLRFLIPICALTGAEITLTGEPGLLKRPVKTFVESLRRSGIRIEDDNGFPPVKIFSDGFNGDKIEISGDISSQFISGLLLSLPIAEQKNEVEITTEIESKPYIQMTLETLSHFGINIMRSSDFRKFIIPPMQEYSSSDYLVEGDFSSAAFLIAGAVLTSEKGVSINGLKENSIQGDSLFIKLLMEMGATITSHKNRIYAEKSELRGITIDAKNIPDLVPILVVVATQAQGLTKIINAGRLRIKESDRLSAIASELMKMGADIKELEDSLEIKGPTKLNGAIINPHNDHRIAMACTIAGLLAEGDTKIQSPEVVKKSYPDFFYHMRKLGATILSQTSSIGEKLKIQLYGGSHEKVVGIRIDGIPKGTAISLDKIHEDLAKRRPFGTLTTPRREKDEFSVIKGLRCENNICISTGEQTIIEIPNKDVNSLPYEKSRFIPRPGHGDYTTYIKYGGVFDFRGGGFLSARMTVGTVIAGSIAKQILEKHGIGIIAYVKQIGTIKIDSIPSFKDANDKTYQSEVRCPDLDLSKKMIQKIESFKEANDSLGGIVECQVHGLPVGIGEPIFNSIDSVLSQYLFSIPAVKGVEFGSGFSGSSKKGSENNDQYETINGNIVTKSNNSGGILGGITNGMPLVCRIAIKPTSSIAKEQDSIDMRSMKSKKIKVFGRHDPCVAIRAPIIVESTIAIALLDLLLRR